MSGQKIVFPAVLRVLSSINLQTGQAGEAFGDPRSYLKKHDDSKGHESIIRMTVFLSTKACESMLTYANSIGSGTHTYIYIYMYIFVAPTAIFRRFRDECFAKFTGLTLLEALSDACCDTTDQCS